MLFEKGSSVDSMFPGIYLESAINIFVSNISQEWRGFHTIFAYQMNLLWIKKLQIDDIFGLKHLSSSILLLYLGWLKLLTFQA